MDTASDAITFYRAGAERNCNANGNALPLINATPNQLDDSTVDRGNGQFSSGNPNAASDNSQLSFSDVLERYLKRSCSVTIRDYRGHTQRYRLTDEELGDNAVTVYEEALKCIQESDLTSIPISPIDYITQRLERAQKFLLKGSNTALEPTFQK